MHEIACIYVIALQCPPLPPIENGMITYSPDLTPDYDIGTVATYVCNAGFVLDLTTEGSEIRTCVASREWNDQEPRCIRKCIDKTIMR